jgi:hypothetical protein
MLEQKSLLSPAKLQQTLMGSRWWAKGEEEKAWKEGSKERTYNESKTDRNERILEGQKERRKKDGR